VEKDDEIVFEITNEYEVDRIMYYVDKIWEDAHDKDGERPEKLTINLLANGEIIDTIDLTMNDAYIIDEEDEDYVTGDIWGFVWEGLPYADEYAKVIVYTAEEILESDEYEQLEMYNDEYGTLFINYHELDDPCAEGGCGGDIIPPIAPETGKFTGVRGGGNVTYENTLAAGLAVVMMTLVGMPILATVAIRRKK
ncbi:Cna B-type domain-containing protein, partial [Candidatus Saccharibacteria bacterium]|nr:Cna B-type domain-containing protein [Candidatus Saccharibacteria bacterium]